MQHIPVPPFTLGSALAKVQAVEEAWGTRDLNKIVQAYAPDCIWQNSDETFQGRAAIEFFLNRKWKHELNCQLTKELKSFANNQISVRLVYEWQHADTGQWYRSHGNEHWEFDSDGYMTRCDTNSNDMPISICERYLFANIV